MTEPHPFPRGKDALLREVDAKTRIKDIRALYRLREAAEIRWWEAGLVAFVFASALGFLTTIIFRLWSLPSPESVLQDKILLFWFVPLVLSFVMSIEVYRNKLNAMRRLQDMTAQLLESTRRDLAELRRELEDQAGDSSDAEV